MKGTSKGLRGHPTPQTDPPLAASLDGARYYHMNKPRAIGKRWKSEDIKTAVLARMICGIEVNALLSVAARYRGGRDFSKRLGYLRITFDVGDEFTAASGSG